MTDKVARSQAVLDSLQAEWSDKSELLLVAVVVTLGVLGLSYWRPYWTRNRWFVRLALGATLVLSLVCAWRLRWLSDDAFISFRYARNWVEGHGLVFNLGEKVEGYTNFLWVVLLAAAHSLGVDMPTAAVVFSLGFSTMALLLTYHLGRRWMPTRKIAFVLPVACIALALNYTWASFSTGGLETMLAAAMVLLALERAYAERPLQAGLANIAATMAHPDHAIFYVALAVALLLDPRRRRGLVWYGLAFVLVYLPYTVLRWKYFGEFFPNTYYAKAGHLANFPQGWFYLWASTLACGLWALLPLSLYGLVALRSELVVRYTAIAVPLYLVYVAKIGGDYMLGRLLTPILPLVFLVSEQALLHMTSRWPVALAATASLSFVPLVVPAKVIPPAEVKWYLTDERTMYPLKSLSPLEIGGTTAHRGEMLARYLANEGVELSYAAFAIGYVGWRTGWKIVDLHGLIDPVLARMPLVKRGRPGHERSATVPYVKSKDPYMSSIPLFGPAHAQLTSVTLFDQGFYFGRFSEKVAEALRGLPDVKFTDMPSYLDAYIEDLELRRKVPDHLRQDMPFFDEFYFRNVQDEARRQKLLAYLGGVGN
ncbi:MAG: hypothetical protein KA712_08135 [Myxococcales bacterium]|nr:hypothetical protein [Myxococcales bacterium]